MAISGLLRSSGPNKAKVQSGADAQHRFCLAWLAYFGTTAASDISLRGYARPPRDEPCCYSNLQAVGRGKAEPPLLTRVPQGSCLAAFSALARQVKVQSTLKEARQNLAAGAACTALLLGQSAVCTPASPAPPCGHSPPCYFPPRSWGHTPPAWPWSLGLCALCSPVLGSLHTVGLQALSCPTAELKPPSTQPAASSLSQGFSLTASICGQKTKRVLGKQCGTGYSAPGAALGARVPHAC